MTITDIIRNEIQSIIGHQPDKAELDVFMEHLHDFISDKYEERKKNPMARLFLCDIEMNLRETARDYFRSCQDCGECFLPDEMNDDGYHCLNCKPHQDPDLWRELDNNI